jgi:hypothetical protein
MPIAGLLLKLNGFYHKLDKRPLNGVRDRKKVVEVVGS